MAEIGLRPIAQSDPILHGLRGHFLQLIKNATHTTDRLHGFPGTMPLTLSRRHLHMVASNDYVVLEKSDGCRYMLLAVPDFVVLIDRQMRFYIVEPNPAILTKGFTEPQDNTCLDGELTYNIMTQQWDYLIYDAVAIDGDLSVAQRSFRQRMQAAEVFVAGPRLWAPFCSGLLRLRIKDYYEKRNIRQLFSKIRRDPKGHYLYINQDRRDGIICNENDGVILAPVGMAYQVRNCPALLKWKPPHLNSIDFQLLLEKIIDTKRNNQPSVKCHIGYKSERGVTKLREVYFPSKLRRQFAANFDEYNNSIVELAYDRMAGEWKYIRRREDKEVPNFSSTVIDTMETIAESMERQELVNFLENSKPPPQSEQGVINAVAKNVEVCTYRDDLFDENNQDYLIATPISLVRPPLITPPPRRHRGPRRPEGRNPPARVPNGDSHAGPAPEGGVARAPFEYSDDV